MFVRKLTRVTVHVFLFCAIGLPFFSQAEQGEIMDKSGQEKDEAMISTQTMEVKTMAPIDARQPDVIATASFGLG